MAEPYLTMAEIEARYPNEWVFLINPTHRRKWGALTGGCVVFHSPDRAEFLRMVGEWDDPSVKHTASWYTGKDTADDIEPVEPEHGVA